MKNILIVGGGAAGWLTAAYLAKTLGARRAQPETFGPEAPGVAITLVESPEIGILGVGEGTFPSIKGALSALGVSEAAFMRSCEASFKQGVRFVDWVRPPGSPGRDHYFHPFNLPSQRPGGPELLPYWLMGAGSGAGFAESATLQAKVAEAGRAPKRPGDSDFQGPMNYAYHFDAVQFAAFLCQTAQDLGVRRILANVERVELDAQGAIAAVYTPEAGALSADLYIDCSGFRARLIGEALESPFHSVRGELFADRAVAMQVPHSRPDSPVAPYTCATAQAAGWIWDIGLRSRRGTGYVYSSDHTSDDEAEAALRAYLGASAGDGSVRRLRYEAGYRLQPWIKNCVAVGLAGGFLEPLESSGLGLVETAAYLIAHLLPSADGMAGTARLFNELMVARYARVVDFLKLHYAVSQRRDTPFWRDNTLAATRSSALGEKLAMWRTRPPHRLDFVTDLELYLPSSWQFVLYGMEFGTDMAHAARAHPRMDDARREIANLAQVAGHAIADLPSHRAMLEHIHA